MFRGGPWHRQACGEVRHTRRLYHKHGWNSIVRGRGCSVYWSDEGITDGHWTHYYNQVKLENVKHVVMSLIQSYNVHDNGNITK